MLPCFLYSATLFGIKFGVFHENFKINKQKNSTGLAALSQKQRRMFISSLMPSSTDHCPMIHIPGFTFPVVEYLLEDVIEKLR